MTRWPPMGPARAAKSGIMASSRRWDIKMNGITFCAGSNYDGPAKSQIEERLFTGIPIMSDYEKIFNKIILLAVCGACAPEKDSSLPALYSDNLTYICCNVIKLILLSNS